MRLESIYTYMDSLRGAQGSRVTSRARRSGFVPVVVGFAALFVLASSAHADPPSDPRSLLVTVTTESEDHATQARAVRARLEALGWELLPAASASELVETAESANATPIAASDLDRWASRSHAALRFLSRGEYDQARRALLEAQAISERAAEALNRETVRARQVLDTCLYVVRAALETRDVEGAEQQARRCRRLVPRMQASAYTHTPEVRALLERVDAELEREPTGVLTVSSEPAACTVRINGVHFGATPLRTSELPRGDYRVQVECDPAFAGRVHRVVIAESDVTVHVRAAFDRALRSSPELGLVYADADAARRRAGGDAAALARSVGRTLVVVEPGPTRWTILTVDPRGRRSAPRTFAIDDPLASQDVLESFARDALDDERATSRARRGRRAEADDRATGDASPRDEGSSEPGTSPRARSIRRLGLGLLGVGASALVATSALVPTRARRGETFDAASPSSAGYLDLQADYLRLRPVLAATSVTFALSAATGVSLVLREVPRSRAYGIVGGLLGLGLAGYATSEFARAPICYGDAICTERDARIDRAVLFASMAGPLLAMPVAAVGGPRERGLRARATVGEHHALLVLRGALR